MASRAIKHRHNVRVKSGKAIALAIIAVLIAVTASLIFGVTALANAWLSELPDYTDADEFNSSSTSIVYASDGETVLAEFQLENREPVEFDQISKYVLEGTVATEDERFYTHSGVDFYGTARAVVNNLAGGSREGGSTITQQLVRNTVLSEEMNEISIKRKLREMYIATKVEEMYEKDEILLMYLNTINYGSGAYGIEAAAERYFSKHAIDLNLNESATLIGIPQSPTYNNPIDHMENCLARRNLVLDRMVSNGYITAEEAAATKEEPIVLNPTVPSTTGIMAYPYFTSYVRNQLLNADGRYGFSTADLFAGGLEIITTLDIPTQQAAEEAARQKLNETGGDYEVAMVSLDNDNGFITAMIGGDDYDLHQVNMATGEGGSGRQCGSSFKTYTLLAALEAGINPDTTIDAGYSVDLQGAEPVYNFNKRDYGTRSIASAFAVSSNTAFIRLILSVGVDNVKEMAQRLGLKGTLPEVAGLTLGIASTTPLEMASAYSTIATGGIHYDPECIVQIKDRKGQVIVDNTDPKGERLLSEEVACAAIQVMEGVMTDGTGTSAQLSNGQPAAGKTGTSEDMKDSWFVGFTPQMTTAVWLGDRADTYDQARRVTNTVTSFFAVYMNKVLAGAPIEQFPTAAPPEYIDRYIDEKNHIGTGVWSPSSNDEDVGEELEDESNEGSTSGGSSSSEPTTPTTPEPTPVEPEPTPVDPPTEEGE